MANFWSSQETAPKRSYRFLIEINGEPIWWAKNVNTPSFDVGEIEHSFLGGKYYFPGKVSWTEVSMTLVDPVSPDSVAFTNSLLVASGYVIPNAGLEQANNDLKTVSKVTAQAVTADMNIKIIVLNEEGAQLEVWTLNQAFIKSAKFGDLSYEDENLRTVDITWRYDWASCEFNTEHPDPNLHNKKFFDIGGNAAGPSNYGQDNSSN